jgi:glutamate-1-semialdehyde 2,1-aminomutase
VIPDLTILGKILGGGLPVGAYGGPRDLMEKVAPSGNVYQAGTLSGNPLAMAAGIAMLREIVRRPPYEELERKGALLEAAIREAIRESGAEGAVTYQRTGSLSTLFFARGPVTDFAAARRSDTARYATFFHALLARGIFLPPAQFEAWFLSTAHTDADLRRTARAVGEALREIFGISDGPPSV